MPVEVAWAGQRVPTEGEVPINMSALDLVQNDRLIPGQNLDARGFTGGAGEGFHFGACGARDAVGALRPCPELDRGGSEPVRAGAIVAHHQSLPFERGEQAERRRLAESQLAREARERPLRPRVGERARDAQRTGHGLGAGEPRKDRGFGTLFHGTANVREETSAVKMGGLSLVATQHVADGPPGPLKLIGWGEQRVTGEDAGHVHGCLDQGEESTEGMDIDRYLSSVVVRIICAFSASAMRWRESVR